MRAVLLILFACEVMAANPRVRYTINDGWRYAAGPVADAKETRFDDNSWQTINLPHSWNVADAHDETPGYRRGVGWYRRQMELDQSVRGKRLFLFFEGANQVADVFVNGRHAGQHIGGYTAFSIDVTDLVSFEEPNVVAVRVDNSHSADIPPLNADFTFYGGIYRDVWLIATDPIHVTVTDHASPGIFIDTPEVSAERGTVRIRGTILNDGPRGTRIHVRNRILDRSGSDVALATATIHIPAHSSREFTQFAVVRRPLLWSPAEPNLYIVRTEILDGSRLVDVVENPLGFRWFSVDPSRGFFLNGLPLRLNGTNRHQDFAGLGSALPDEFHRRDVRLVKETGFNFLRLAHYPQDSSILDEADRLGLVIWEEIPVVNLIGMSAAFAANSERMLREMIRQHYNHPSVVFWGYMNEVLLIKPNPVPHGYYEAVAALTRRLEAVVDEEDRMRLTVIALSRDEIPIDYGIGDIPDILGLNLYFGWYYETLEALTPFLQRLRRERGSRPLLVSEYGADSDERVHSRTPVAFDFSSEYAQRFHTSSFSQMQSLPYLVGTAVWNQFDFGSEFRSDTKHALNQKGLYFYDRTPKDTAYYYKAALGSGPVLYIAREWSNRAGSDEADRIQPLWVYSNADEVELFVNGRSAGVRLVENRTASWDVTLRDGQNELRARARSGIEDVVRISYVDRFRDCCERAINAGAAYTYADSGGVVWETDRGFGGGESVRTHHRIFSTPEDPLFQSARQGMTEYHFAVPEGIYEVTLAFAEIDRKIAPGERVFSVAVNGVQAISDLDLVRQHGRFTAMTRRVVVNVEDSGGVRVGFTARAGQALICGLRVRRLHGSSSNVP